MKKLSLFAVIPLFAAFAFADSYNNFTGYSDYWHPLGNPNTATYGELFTAPSDGQDLLTSFSFYMGDTYAAGNIDLAGYIATWTGTSIGTLLYSSSEVNYANTGDAEITFSGLNVNLTAGQEYVIFLSVSNYYGLSSGEAYASQGSSIPGLDGFVYDNNGGDFASLYTDVWAGPLSPDWAVDIETSASGTPEPGTLALMGTGLLAVAAFARRRIAK